MKTSTSKKGFSLIEVVVGIMVFSMTVLYTFELFSSGYRYYLRTKQRTIVESLSEQKLELVRKNVEAGDYSDCPSPSFSSTGNFSGANHVYQFTVNCFDFGTTDPTKFLVQIQVLVEGPMFGGALSPSGKNITLVTLVAQNSIPGGMPAPPAATIPTASPPPPPTPFPLPP